MPILFRCFQCNQVLKTSRAKAGAVVACPKCGVELLVPEPEAAASASRTGEVGALGNAAGASASASASAPSSSGVFVDVPDIRPEDIRVQIDVDMKPPTSAPARRHARGAEPGAELTIDPAAFTAEPPAVAAKEPELPPDLNIEPLPIREETKPAWMSAGTRTASPTTRPAPRAPRPSSETIPVPLPPPGPEPEPPAVRAENSLRDHLPANRQRDIILPRTAVLGWSLFALLALAMTFLAGLLTGHFLWVVKVVKTTM